MKVRYTLSARAELDEIADYLKARSPSGAGNVRKAVKKTVALIKLHPRAGRKQNQSAVRKLKIGKYPYLIYDRVGSDSIEILCVRHAARRRKFRDT